MKDIEKVVLAYSGGLDTSIIVTWLKENYDCEVITFTAALGQDTSELDGLEEKAIATGASKAYIMDLTEEFLTDYVFPTIKAGAVYEKEYLLGTSFARPLIGKYMPRRRERTRLRTAARERGTTRYASSWHSRRSTHTLK